MCSLRDLLVFCNYARITVVRCIDAHMLLPCLSPLHWVALCISIAIAIGLHWKYDCIYATLAVTIESKLQCNCIA